MGQYPYHSGMIVEHPNRPEWGLGKIICVVGSKVHVFFQNIPDRVAKKIDINAMALRIADSQTDSLLDNLPPAKQEGENWVLPRQRITVEQALDSFLHRYPEGFHDRRYMEEERNYKWSAHEHFEETLGNGRAEELLANGQIEELVRRALFLITRINLLSPFEKAATREAMRDPRAAKQFFAALVELLRAPIVDATAFEPYAKAVYDLPAELGRARVATWPVATILPFLAQPARHMFLKPSVTPDAAMRVGFHLHYDSKPNWQTYDALLRMGRVYADLLKNLGPKDMIDIQSFIWVTCSGQSTP